MEGLGGATRQGFPLCLVTITSFIGGGVGSQADGAEVLEVLDPSGSAPFECVYLPLPALVPLPQGHCWQDGAWVDSELMTGLRLW